MSSNEKTLNSYEKIEVNNTKCNRCYDESIIGVCIDNKCKKNGGLCYNCIHEDHIEHGKNCIPISKIKVEQFKQDEFINVVSIFAQYLEKTQEKINFLISEKIQEINDLKDIDINSFTCLSKLAFWKNLKQNKNEWILSKKSTESLFRQKCCSILNELKEKVELLFDYEEYFRNSVMQNWDKINYNIHPIPSIIKGYIEEDTLIFTPKQPGLFFSGFGLFSRLSTLFDSVTITLSKEDINYKQQKVSCNWNHTTCNINEINECSLFTLDKIIELSDDTKYFLNLKINKEISYSTKGLFSELNNVKAKFSFYEIQAEKMLKLTNSKLVYSTIQDKITTEPSNNIKMINYKELTESFPTIFSFLQIYEKKENPANTFKEPPSDL